MINCEENDDGSFTITWNENDPLESVLNTWTEDDFIKAIMDHVENVSRTND